MLGITRFILALLVLLSHATGSNFHFNPGVVAVIVFYFTSGYLMQRSYRRFVSHSTTPVRSFYTDRFLKLFPQYGLVVLTSFAAIAWLGPAQHVLFMNQPASLEKVLLNLALLPANYVFEPLTVERLLPHPIVPPAWSLAAEFHFYLLLPTIALLPRRAFLAVLAVTTSIQVTALFFGSGPFNSDNFGYRFIFGALTFFLFGYAHARREEPGYAWIPLALWLVYASLLLVVAPTFGLFSHPFVMELLLGAVLAWPLLSAALGARPDNVWLKKADNLLGRLAYPIFISHFLAFFFCEKLLGFDQGQQGAAIPASIALSLGISWLLLRLQTSIDAYRLRRRGFASMASGRLGSAA
ncbi:acyltransferase family protein [Pseudomonas aeruginosa]|uniref:acyltransferase family protein n=1 Tax=Pseudomonas aeruginosa group TaxID=136841 RepID=UPI0006B28061|nr:acyltransferase [Pseudomonas aeruginosa]KRU92626.1 hypothetical protein AN454_13205 [Pseudomonas aeruginosa]VTS49173.1 Acyltransferase family [Streptococcus dysgalactiae subsp. equisimilis]